MNVWYTKYWGIHSSQRKQEHHVGRMERNGLSRITRDKKPRGYRGVGRLLKRWGLRVAVVIDNSTLIDVEVDQSRRQQKQN